uniref:Solute carrier family 16 member 6 n=1 Tax=Dicentrarchus labrax TaxID=13489 RepID=A0A8P4KTK7_DICLA
MALCGAKGARFLGPNVYPEAPDGGWGWVVAVAFFFVEVLTYGIIKSFGIFLQDLMMEFGEPNSRVSWIVSICVFVMTFNGPLSSVMTNRFGFQLVVMIGGLLISTGTIATSFTSSVNQMYITYGLVAAFSALRDHIGWRHSMAVIGALQSIIIICGALLRPIIIKSRANPATETDLSSPKELEALSTRQNLEGTNPEDSMTSNAHAQNTSHSLDNELTRGSVSTGDSGVQSLKDTDSSSAEEKTLLDKEARLETEQTSVENSMAKITESETEEKNSKDEEKQLMKDEEMKTDDEKAKNSKLLDFSILRECSFILYSLFGLFATLGFFAPPLYIIELSVSRGVERDSASYMLSTMAVAEIIGRFSVGWILSRKQLVKKKLLVLLACVIAMTADLVGFTLVREFYGLVVCCALYGFFMGTLACTHIPMLAEDDVVGIERMSSAAGVYVFIQSFAGLAGPPLGGVLVDVTRNYGSAFYSCAVGMALSAVFLGLVKPAKRGLLCRKRDSKRAEDIHERKLDSEEQSAVNKQVIASPQHCSEIDDYMVQDKAEATRDVQGIVRFA